MSALARALAALVLALGLLGVGAGAPAADGVIEINQARVAAGGITPGDPPGLPALITRPGSYRLTGNLEIGAGGVAIEVVADDVTIDLNGFAIIGTTSCTGSPVTSCTPQGSPSALFSGRSRTTLRNGTIRGSSDVGAWLGDYARIENVTFEVNGGGGARAGRQSEIVECIAHRNGWIGISIDSGSIRSVVAAGNAHLGLAATGIEPTLVSDAVTAGNGGDGLMLEMGRAEGLVSVSNLGWGVFGSPSNDSPVVVTDSVVRANAAEGLKLAIFGAYLRNVIAGNGGTGQVIGGQALGCNFVGGARVCPP